jgi:putative nucleotidyltransferase with HDIG domain
VKSSKIKNIMAAVKSFPGMPGAAAKLLSLLNESDTSVTQVEEILKYDPGLTANVLKLTNSAYFGLPSKIGSVRQAVILLGAKKLIQLVLASCVRAVMGKAVAGYDLPAGELWRHSIAVSVAAETLVKELKLPAIDVVFTAALLHDVGKLALGGFVDDDLKEIEGAASADIPFEVAEQSVLGTDHAEVGALILNRWSFPPDIVRAVQWHHAPDAGPQTSCLVDVVHVANVLATMIGIGGGREGLRHLPSEAAVRRLGLRAFQLEKVASQTLQWISELSDISGLNQEPVR